MLAAILEATSRPLRLVQRPDPKPGPGQLLIRVKACGVCRTDLHVADGELPDPRLPLILGHQVVGTVLETDAGVGGFSKGDRVGVPWLGFSCGRCRFCQTGRENLCDAAGFTGYQLDGGFAEQIAAQARFCFRIPKGYSDPEAAPLLCAGLIGYRALRLAGAARRIGFYGFGASAHLLIQVARFEGRQVYVFTRPGDSEAQAFARQLGADWVGGSDGPPPEPLEAAIVFAPVGALVPAALKAVEKGGRVVCAGIHMSDIPSFSYALLWGERRVQSVANLTRQDGEEFLALAPRVPVRTQVQVYPLERVNEALADFRNGRVRGAAVVSCDV